MVLTSDRLEIKEGSSSSSSSEHDALSDPHSEESSEEGEEPQFVKSKNIDAPSGTVEFPTEKPVKAKRRKRTKREEAQRRAAKKELDRLAMVLPDVVKDREKERALARIATNGVVRLFNAVAERQKELDEKLGAKREKLSKTAKRQIVDEFRPSKFKVKLAKSDRSLEEEESKPELLKWITDSPVKSEASEDRDFAPLDASEIKVEADSD